MARVLAWLIVCSVWVFLFLSSLLSFIVRMSTGVWQCSSSRKHLRHHNYWPVQFLFCLSKVNDEAVFSHSSHFAHTQHSHPETRATEMAFS